MGVAPAVVVPSVFTATSNGVDLPKKILLKIFLFKMVQFLLMMASGVAIAVAARAPPQNLSKVGSVPSALPAGMPIKSR